MAFSTRSEIVTIDPSEFSLVVTEQTISQYFQVAIVTGLVYHAITTLDKEVKFFWGAPLNTVTAVYFANRYIGIFGAISDLIWAMNGVNLQFFSIWTANITYYVIIISIDYILVIRVIALYSQSRRLAYILKTLLGLEAIIKPIFSIYVILAADIVVGSFGHRGPTICGTENSGSLMIPLGIVDWVIPMVFGVILMALAIYKATEVWKMSVGFKGFNLVEVLIVDQFIYFVLAISCCVLNIMQIKLKLSNTFASILVNALGKPSTLSVMGSIMLFNLKEAGERGLNQGTSYRVDSRSVSVEVSAMEFA